jgi:hypothetical protein
MATATAATQCRKLRRQVLQVLRLVQALALPTPRGHSRRSSKWLKQGSANNSLVQQELTLKQGSMPLGTANPSQLHICNSLPHHFSSSSSSSKLHMGNSQHMVLVVGGHNHLSKVAHDNDAWSSA